MIANVTIIDTQYIAMTANVDAYRYCYCYVLHYCTIAHTTLQEFAPAIFTRCVALVQACIVATATAQHTGSIAANKENTTSDQRALRMCEFCSRCKHHCSAAAKRTCRAVLVCAPVLVIDALLILTSDCIDKMRKCQHNLCTAQRSMLNCMRPTVCFASCLESVDIMILTLANGFCNGCS
jgi:hypothetical protein